MIQSEEAQILFWIFLGAALCVFGVCFIVGIIKSFMVGDGANSTKKVFSKALQALLLFIGIAPGFIFFMSITTNLMMLVIEFVSQTLGAGDGKVASISETLMEEPAGI